MGRICGALTGAALIVLFSSSASGTIPVLDQRPSFATAASPAVLVPGGHEAELVLAGGPPPWAPAHGYRRKHGKAKHNEVHVHHHYHDHDERVRVGIERGFCNRELVGGILGGVAGGVIGSQVGEGNTRTATTIGGTIAGVLIGGAIGRRMDETDHACVAHAVAHGSTGQAVAWSGPRGDSYQIVPLAAAYTDGGGRTCREFRTIVEVDGVRRTRRGTACRESDGYWQGAS